MKSRSVVSLVLGVTLLAAGTAYADRDPSARVQPGTMTSGGRLCGFTSATDALAGPGIQSGVIDGGPLVLPAFDGGAIPRYGHLRCSIRVGVGGARGGPEVAAVVGPDTAVHAVLPPETVRFVAAPRQPVWLCTQLRLDGTSTIYWDHATGGWTTRAAATCEPATKAATPDELNPVADAAESAERDLSATVTPLVPDCADSIDNDGDGFVDYPADFDCANPTDTSEATRCPRFGTAIACASYRTGAVFKTVTAFRPANAPARVAGYVHLYDFTVPGGTVTTACVVLVEDDTVSDPCRAAGGVEAGRIATLVDASAAEPTTGFAAPFATVRICRATLVLTLNGAGVRSFPGYSTC